MEEHASVFLAEPDQRLTQQPPFPTPSAVFASLDSILAALESVNSVPRVSFPHPLEPLNAFLARAVTKPT